MKILYSNTKTGKARISRAQNWQGVTLDEVYGRYSPDKARAWKWCNEQAEKDRRLGRMIEPMRICSHNTFSYTVAWEAYRIDPRTKRKTAAWIIHTAQNEYWIFEV